PRRHRESPPHPKDESHLPVFVFCRDSNASSTWVMRQESSAVLANPPPQRKQRTRCAFIWIFWSATVSREAGSVAAGATLSVRGIIAHAFLRRLLRLEYQRIVW